MVRVLILKLGASHRRIGVFAPGSAYRRISCPDRRIGVPAYRRIGVFPARIGVSAYRRMCPLRATRRRIGVSAQGGFATLFAGTLMGELGGG